MTCQIGLVVFDVILFITGLQTISKQYISYEQVL